MERIKTTCERRKVLPIHWSAGAAFKPTIRKCPRTAVRWRLRQLQYLKPSVRVPASAVLLRWSLERIQYRTQLMAQRPRTCYLGCYAVENAEELDAPADRR